MLIITATSGASHLILHGAESDFTVTEVFEQFLARATEWCGGETKLRALGAPGLELFNFGDFGGRKVASVVDKQIPRLKPLRLDGIEHSFFQLENKEQTQIADLAEAIREGCLGGKQADIWTCGEMGHMVGTRLNKYNVNSSEKMAILIFDRSLQVNVQMFVSNFFSRFFFLLNFFLSKFSFNFFCLNLYELL